MRDNKSLISVILILCFLTGVFSSVMPINSYSALVLDKETKQIMLGAEGISPWSATDGYDYLYYGKYGNNAIKWRVLDTKTNMVNSVQSDGMFVLSEDVLETGIFFDNNSPYSNDYQGSEAQVWCNNFGTSKLSANELNAILETTKNDNAKIVDYNKFGASEKILNGDKIFLLSSEEISDSKYGFINDLSRVAKYGTDATDWWLRSSVEDYSYYSGRVTASGSVDFYSIYGKIAVRPAFNLAYNSVLFTSAANDGKSFSDIGEGSFHKNAEYIGNEWKATLLDTSRTFSVTETSIIAVPGGVAQINYDNANIGVNEYVSAMIVDENDSVLYYGNIAHNSENGKASFTIPESLSVGDYTLNVFSEQKNDAYMTDYASSFEEIALTVMDAHVGIYEHSVKGTNTNYTCSFTMKSAENITGVFLIALYDEDNTLVGCETVKMDTEDTNYKETDNDITALPGAKTYKIMFWNNLDELKPHVVFVGGNVTEG